MSGTPDPYDHSSPSPWWGGKFSGTSGGVKLSLVTDQRSEKPSFWEPRPADTPASSAATAPASFSTPTVTSPASPTRSLESVRKAPALKDQHKHKQRADGDSNSNSNSNSNSSSSSKDAKPSYTRQWRHRDAQSTPGTPTSAHTGTHFHHSHRSQSSAHWNARGTWRSSPEADGGVHLDAHAQEFVPGRGPSALAPMEEVDLNEYVRAGAGSETTTMVTMTSSRVSVFGSRSRSPSRSESAERDERGTRSTERERAEAERQWHLQASWDDANGVGESAGDEWRESAPGIGIGLDEREGREENAGEVKPESEGEGDVHRPESAEVPAPASLVPPAPPPLAPTSEAQTALPSVAFGLLLGRAKMIEEGARVPYPMDVKPPGADTNSGMWFYQDDPVEVYDRDFLLQFQTVCTGRPTTVPDIPQFWYSILAPYGSRPAAVRTREKWVQASLGDDRDGAPLKDQGGRRTVDSGVETNQPSTNGDRDATTRIVDVVYNRLVDDRPPSLAGCRSSSGELTCRATPSRDENVFDYEVQEAQRERLEARVEYLAAEVKVLRLELARIRKVFG
ncbi:hypothetical protein LXA43DRAFT_1061574 [Ganoderma leucocontextum]|nr:hypothetical protein LXA43DRAFT_1061574 [Ganoderma leucocontextum]